VSRRRAPAGRAPACARLRLAARRLRGAACALALLPLGARAEPASEAAPRGAPAEAVDLHQLHRQAAESFYATDGDRDGSVAAPEAMEMTPERFEAADRDGDGKLTLVEWVDARFE
jgi:hypothetical protein